MKKLEQYFSKIMDAIDLEKFDSYTINIVDDKIVIVVKEEYRDHEFGHSYYLSRSALRLMDLEKEQFDPYKELAHFLRNTMDQKIERFDFN
jgi:hypothetical protein